MRGLIVTSIAQFRAEGNQKAACIFVKKGYTKYNRYKTRRRGSPCQSGAGKREMRMFSNQPRKFYRRSPLIEVICQLRFPDILKIEAHEPADFQDAIRQVYPQYAKRIEQLPPQNAGGKMVEQGTVNNYQFISADGGWKVSLTKGFIALSTTRYTRWEEFAKRLDVVLAAFIKIYQPAYFTRVGLRYMNAVNKAALGFAETPWHELIAPGYLGLMADEDARRQVFIKCEQLVTVTMPGGAKANIKCGPGLLRKVDNRTRQVDEQKVFMLDLDVFFDGKMPLGQVAGALNIVHDNAGSLFSGAVRQPLLDAMEPEAD